MHVSVSCRRYKSLGWDVMPCQLADSYHCVGGAYCFNLGLLDPEDGALYFFKASVTTDMSTWCNIPEDLNLHGCCSENIESQTVL